MINWTNFLSSSFVLFQCCNCAKTAASHVPRRKTPLPVTWSMAKFGAQCFASTTLRFYFLTLLRNCSGTYFNFREKHCKSAKLPWHHNFILFFSQGDHGVVMVVRTVWAVWWVWTCLCLWQSTLATLLDPAVQFHTVQNFHAPQEKIVIVTRRCSNI